MMASGETITLCKRERGFGWVPARVDEVITVCHGEVWGSQDQLSSFRTETTGVMSAIQLVSSITKEFQSEIILSLWSDNIAIVSRVRNLSECDHVTAFLKNDPDL